MDLSLKYFFRGHASREMNASAFLATLLDYDDAFRREFMALVSAQRPPAQPPLDDSKPDAVLVEDDRTSSGRVDVALEWASTVMLIENKIQSSGQARQLLKYYKGALEKEEWRDKRMAAVYLAPAGMGDREVNWVRESDAFKSRKTDVACLLAWSDVKDCADGLPDGGGWFVREGFAAIEQAIDNAAQEKWPPVGDRGVIRGIVDDAVASLSVKAPDVRIDHWLGRDVERIPTFTPVTVYIAVLFNVQKEPSKELDHVVKADGRVGVTIRTEFRPSLKSQKAMKTSRLGREWETLSRPGWVEVPGAGIHVMQDNGWFRRDEPVLYERDELTELLALRGWQLLEFVRWLFPLAEVAD